MRIFETSLLNIFGKSSREGIRNRYPRHFFWKIFENI